MPPLYSTSLYTIEGAPPFRIASISPKLCLSERTVELASSATCALQYVVGLHVDAAANLVLLSFGEFDRRMRVAALPLDQVLALAHAHEVVAETDGHETDCDHTSESWSA